MSVINQVLNQLERRGAHTAAAQTLVRAVPHTRRNFILPLLAFVVVLMIGIAAWQWVQTRKPMLSSVDRPKVAAASSAQYQPAETVAPVSGVAAANLPASRLSFELSSVPLPSTRQDSEQVVLNEKRVSENRDMPLKSSKPKPIIAAAQNEKVAAKTAQDALPMKHVSPAQQADAEFRKAAALMQQGRIADAQAGYEAALRMDAGHDAARQALVALLLEGKRGTDAERVLQERLESKPDHTGFTMLLARLQVERGAVAEATATLEKALPYASSQADYQAFLAALLQRQNRNDEAIAHYQIALQLAPNNGIWLMGYGISLQAVQRNADAKDAFKHALDTQSLSPDLQAFVQQKLKGL